MTRGATKAAGNIYYQARYRASAANEGLSSREGAAEQLYCGRDVIAKVELDIVRPSPELVAMMADLYGAPELLSYFCANECAIGKSRNMAAVADMPVTQITVKTLNILKDISKRTDRLIEIVEDGVIDEHEIEDINEIIQTLKILGQMGEELAVQTEKQDR